MGLCANFFYDGEKETATLHNRISIDENQLKQAITKKDDLLSFLKPELQDSVGYSVKHSLQGSYKNHTLIRPVSKGKEFDIDVGIYIIGNAEKKGLSAKVAKNLNRKILDKFSQQDVDAELKESKDNCERVAYTPTFHLDIPLYYYNEDTDTPRLATENDGWIDSDPKALQNWFDNAVNSLNELQLARLRRVIRYLKMLVALKWKNSDEGKIPSLAITVLVAKYYNNLSDDEDAFIETIITINSQLQSKFEVLSPINGDDILQLTDEQIEIAKNRFDFISKICNAIKSKENISERFLFWSSIFEHMFPPYSECIHVSQSTSNLPVLSNPPKIRVNHYDEKQKKLINNSVDTPFIACKDENLYFSIDNKGEYPPESEVRWTVRNQGVEAGKINDLGHSQNLTISDQAYEGCAYNGVHYIECIIMNRSHVLGFNSLKVTIKGFSRPLRNPRKNRYGAK